MSSMNNPRHLALPATITVQCPSLLSANRTAEALSQGI
jgi:hypothetical protein